MKPEPHNRSAPQPFDLRGYLADRKAVIDTALDGAMPPGTTPPPVLHEAMRYAVFSGGKRLRPILCMAACEAVCGAPDPALPAALAIELLHTYTLVHDDLPSMDNDTMRRGKPTVHVQYGEANAILAGDALQTLAFELLGRAPAPSRWPPGSLVTELAEAAGSRGVVGGQVDDLTGAGSANAETIRGIHLRKTAGLFRATLRMGAIAANATDTETKGMETYGVSLGMAFQIADDLLDATDETQPDTDRETTCLSVWTAGQARRFAQDHIDTALAALAPVSAVKRAPLAAIARYAVERVS